MKITNLFQRVEDLTCKMDCRVVPIFKNLGEYYISSLEKGQAMQVSVSLAMEIYRTAMRENVASKLMQCLECLHKSQLLICGTGAVFDNEDDMAELMCGTLTLLAYGHSQAYRTSEAALEMARQRAGPTLQLLEKAGLPAPGNEINRPISGAVAQIVKQTGGKAKAIPLHQSSVAFSGDYIVNQGIVNIIIIKK